ncbi:MAG: ABC transporter ATP-binding protein [Candidatus Poseidoniia archaeon]|nr:ABC transporter ATP-binding protein [Candidatus Poseidoniia archaeon]
MLGPNGAGKSTLMKLVLGLARPSLGRVSVDGRNPASDWKLRSRFGFVPEYDCFYDHMTGRDYVAFFLQLQGVTLAEAGERAAALLDDVGLVEAMERRIRTYSHGMRQKTKFARAVAHDPDILVLDEPFQGTDPTTRRLLMERIRKWASEGRTILLSSHILHDVEALTDSIVFLSGGQVLAVGDRHAIQKLMPHVRQKVRLTPIDAGQRPQLARLLLEQPSVEGVSLQRDWVEIDTSDAEAFHHALPSLLRKAKIAIQAIDSPGEDLEALYEKLVGGEQWEA